MRINKRYVLLLTVMLVLSAFFYSYYITMKKINDIPQGLNQNKKPNTAINSNDLTPDSDDSQEVGMIEDKVTPNTVLVKKVVSINTENFKVEYEGQIPDEIVDFNKEQVEEYFSDYGKVIDFSKYKIVVDKELPFLPDSYIIKAEGEYINVYKTDSEGNISKYDYSDEPLLCKNRDSELEKGIEVGTLEEIDAKLQDYE